MTSKSTTNKLQQVFQDREIFQELRNIIKEGRLLPKAREWDVTPKMIEKVITAKPDKIPGVVKNRPYTEAVILDYMRPSLLIQNNQFQIPFSDELANRLLQSKYILEKRIPSVGRIEFINHPTQGWGGTGWVIAENVIVTNRHVATEFAARGAGDSFVFKTDIMGNTIRARIDFYEEYSNNAEFEIAIEKILFVEMNTDLPDVAFLLLDKSSSVPPPIPVFEDNCRDDQNIAVIGYPARDPRGVGSSEAARRIFGDIYEVKRLSPGKIRSADPRQWYFTHDATTLGGNSGSVVLDMETGYAVGLHFAGQLHHSNYAVKSTELLNYLARLKVSVSVPREFIPQDNVFDTQVVENADPEAYRSRTGFDPDFLGNETAIDLPEIRDGRDVLTFTENGKKTGVLNYTHFSVVMSKSRRLCYFSAVNIDGGQSKTFKRGPWQLDPRIPKSKQILKECYGQYPKFSRGHMTRRRDPMWGDNRDARQGGDDSMHVTNAVPQIQPFNGGIWLELENYALENARQDQMRISVMTGPVFSEDDVVKWGVKIPVTFWKVICFIHDQTGQLTATGYLMSQQDLLSHNEFVFGRYRTYQIPLKVIEERAGISFKGLANYDPLNKFDESIPEPLQDFSQIVFG
ncbi:MAG: DNA/RNA non-specific endonuclease [Calditrichaeota bacterium]|nr:DNA/RNA non-specific endonuclease [Calditrichota bacterium]